MFLSSMLDKQVAIYEAHEGIQSNNLKEWSFFCKNLST